MTRVAPVGVPKPDRVRPPAAGIARGAALIAGLTLVSRLLGLVRTLVFSQTIGAGCVRVAAWALAGSQMIIVLADVVLADLVSARLVVAALGLGNTIGQTLVAVPLVMATRRIRGSSAVEGAGRATFAGLAAACAASAAGLALCLVLPVSQKLEAAGAAVAAAGGAVLVFGLVVYALDKGDLRAVLARLRQRRRLEA
jgi:hypothetical protein